MFPFAFVALSCCLAFQPLTMTTKSPASPVKTIRNLSETLSSKRWGTADITQRTAQMQERTAALAPLTTDELDDIIYSIQNLNNAEGHPIDYDALRQVLAETAHLSHNDWPRSCCPEA